MNAQKRERIHALSILVSGLIDEEKQALSSLPDNAENANEAAKFRAAIADLDDAYHSLIKAKARKT